MLAEEKKQHIHLEEAYRREVRKQLEGNDPQKLSRERRLAFLNSPLFLWILSTCVISFGTFLYTRWEKNREGERRRYEQHQLIQRENVLATRRFDAEISSRLNDFASAMSNAFDDVDGSRLRKALKALDRPSASEYPAGVFPDYANRSLRSLLWELLQIVPDSEKSEITTAFNRSKLLYQVYVAHNPTAKSLAQGTTNGADSRPQTSLDLFAIQLEFDLERWGRPLNRLVLNPRIEVK